MTTPRDFLALVVLDHRFMLSVVEDKLESTGKALKLACSCGWVIRRLSTWKEVEDGYSTTLTSEWIDRVRLEHLLDQRLDETAIVDLLGEVAPHA